LRTLPGETTAQCPTKEKIAMTTRCRSLWSAAAIASAFLLLGSPAPRASDGAAATDPARHQGHAGHQMTPEQIVTLKKKVPLYADFTDGAGHPGLPEQRVAA
jgi:hypothetical protein